MKKIFAKSSEINVLILLFSYFIYPLSLLLAKFKIKPNLITSASLLLAIYGSYQFTLGNVKLFIIFWILGILLDFCDGQVARITSNINKTKFNYDGLSDLVKMSSLIICSALYYDEKTYWLISCVLVFLIPFFSVLHVEYQNIKFRKKINISKNFFKKNIIMQNILSNFISIFFKIDGHSFFLFLLVIINYYLACITLLYIILIVFLNILRYAYLLLKYSN